MQPLPTSPVTDHALLRFLERFEGVDLPAARARLADHLGGRVAELLEFAGDAPFRIHRGGDIFCGRGGRIVTCYRRGSIATRGAWQPGRQRGRTSARPTTGSRRAGGDL